MKVLKFFKNLFNTKKHTLFVNYIVRVCCGALFFGCVILSPNAIAVMLHYSTIKELIGNATLYFLVVVLPIWLMTIWALAVEEIMYEDSNLFKDPDEIFEEEKKRVEAEEKERKRRKEAAEEFVQELNYLVKNRKTAKHSKEGLKTFERLFGSSTI